jgi:hypothetical protein
MIDEVKGIEMFDTWIVGSGSEGHTEVITYLMFNGHVIDSFSRIYWSFFMITLIVGLSAYSEYKRIKDG